MSEPTPKCKKINYGFILFTLTIGLIILGNLFEYLPWALWNRGGIIVGLTLFYNLILRKKCPYAMYQIIVLTLTGLLVAHTVLILTNPDYIKIQSKNMTEFEIFQQKTELVTSYYKDINLKKVNAKIEHGKYELVDSKDNTYYFKMHPPTSVDEDAFILHNQDNKSLDIMFLSQHYKLTPVQKFLKQKPKLVFGSSHIPMDLNLDVAKDGGVTLDFERQKVVNFDGLFQGGVSTITFSQNSLPTEIFKITVRGGSVTLYLPKGINQSIDYMLKNTGELFFDGARVFDAGGNYKILSNSELESPFPVEVTVENGSLEVKTH